MTAIAQEMRLFDSGGHRLYLSADERQRFLVAALQEAREDRVLCQMLHYAGPRITEALELTTNRVLLDEQALVFRSLKKRKLDQRGREKQPQYRTVPVPPRLIDDLDLVFDLRRRTGRSELLFPISRATAWRRVKRVMERAAIAGPQATPKGLRHGFAIALLSGSHPVPLTVLRDLLGHSDIKTTEIYLQAIGQEKRVMVMQAWSD